MKPALKFPRSVRLSAADLCDWETASGSIVIPPQNLAKKFPYLSEWIYEAFGAVADNETSIADQIQHLSKSGANPTEAAVCKTWLETATETLQEESDVSDIDDSDLESALFGKPLLLG